MKVLLAHPGTQYSAQLATQLLHRGLLGAFHTGFMIAERGGVDHVVRLLPRRWGRRLANRRISIPPGVLQLHPWDEGVATVLQRMGKSYQRVLHQRNGRFQGRISDAQIDRATAVIGFDTSGWILAERCLRHGRDFVLDQSIGHPDSKSRIFEQLRERYPSWSQNAEPRLAAVRDAEQVEHDLATRIVAASSFSKQTLIDNGVAPEKISVNPYGVDCTRFVPTQRAARAPMRFCFVGSITVRKGVAQLLDVWRALRPKNAELWLVGPAAPSTLSLIAGVPNVTYKGAVPHTEMAALFSQCDVFVFPSFFEGFGLVILEAMACGLPVITTTATAGPDVVSQGESGWVIAPGDDSALAAAIDHCLENPGEVREAGRRARAAAEACTWERYGERWSQILSELPRAEAPGVEARDAGNS